MELEESRDLLRRCQQDRKAARDALSTAEATIESSGLIIQGILRAFPELINEADEAEDIFGAAKEPAERLKGAEAILSVLQVSENQWFSVMDMTNVLDNRGWLPESANPPNAVRSALERIFASERSVEKGTRNDGTVVYRYHEQKEEPF